MFEWPVRIYYENTDSGGVVYHADYLKFMERARTEWLRSLGFEQDKLIADHQCIFTVSFIQLYFRKPAKFNDILLVSTCVTKLSGASFYCEQKIMRDDELLCEGTVKVACLDSDRLRPRPIPAFISMEMKSDC